MIRDGVRVVDFGGLGLVMRMGDLGGEGLG